MSVIDFTSDNDVAPFAEISADLCCEQALNALDELIQMAMSDDTANLVMANRIFIGQILTRAQLAASLLVAKQPKLTLMGFPAYAVSKRT